MTSRSSLLTRRWFASCRTLPRPSSIRVRTVVPCRLVPQRCLPTSSTAYAAPFGGSRLHSTAKLFEEADVGHRPKEGKPRNSTISFKRPRRQQASVAMSTPPEAPVDLPDAERMETLRTQYAEVRKQVTEACTQAGRDPSDVRLVAVSKTKPACDVLAVHQASGQLHFGENYVQELVDKAAVLSAHCPALQWHYIGHLQSNKCRALCSVAQLAAVETVDRAKIAIELEKQWAAAERSNKLRVFLQANVSGEASKAGIGCVTEMIELASIVARDCPHLQLTGLMTIGEPGQGERDFATLRSWALEVQKALGWAVRLELSMGMSDDFMLAIAQGSTNVRVGSSIFGARSYPVR